MVLFLGWWGGLPPWLRYGVALLLLAISTGLYFFANRIWPWGWVAGVVLLLAAGPSEAEKKGYHDF